MKRCELQAKDLKNRVKIYEPVRKSDGVGGFTRDWVPGGVTSGKINRAAARDERTGELLGAAQTASLILRRQIKLVDGCRLVVDGQEFDFIGYDPAGPKDRFIKVYLRKPEDKRDG